MHWVEIEQPKGSSVPLWQRCGGVAEDGVVFIPAAVTGNEQDVEARAKASGTTVVNHLDHLFVPATWMAVEFSALKQLCELMETKVKGIYQNSKKS